MHTPKASNNTSKNLANRNIHINVYARCMYKKVTAILFVRAKTSSLTEKSLNKTIFPYDGILCIHF